MNYDIESESQPVVAARLRRVAEVLAIAVMVCGAAVLLGWVFDLPILKSIYPSLVSMKPNTAVALVLAGVALWLQRKEGVESRFARFCAASVVVIGALTLSQDVFGWKLHIDQILFTEPAGTIGTGAPGRMSSITALCFVMLGVALFKLNRKAEGSHYASAWLALGCAGILLFPLAGYLYGSSGLRGFVGHTHVAAHTTLSLLSLCLAVLFARPTRGLMAATTGNTMTAELIRRVIPAVIGIPLLIGWLRLQGQRAGFYDTEFGLSLMTVGSVLTLSCLLGLAAAKLLTEERQKRRDQWLLHESTQKLETILDSIGDAVLATDTKGWVVRMNPAAEKLTGWSNAEAVGCALREVFKIVNGDSRAEVEDPVARALREGRVVGLAKHTVLLAKDGTERPIADSAAPIRDPKGVITGVVLVFRDQSEERSAEALRERVLDIEKSKVEIQANALKLEGANEAIRSDRALIDAIKVALSSYISAADLHDVFTVLLARLLELTGSEYAFLDEVHTDAEGRLCLTTLAKTRGSTAEENPSTERVPDLRVATTDGVIVAAITKAEALMVNHPYEDPRLHDAPSGHPEIRSFLALPLCAGGAVVGVLGLANAAQVYSEQTVSYLGPIAAACVNILAASKSDKKRKAADKELHRRVELQNLRASANHAFIEAGADYSTLFQNVATHIATVLRSSCSIRLLSEDGAYLDSFAIADVDPENQRYLRELNDKARLSATEGTLADILRARRSLFVRKLEAGQLKVQKDYRSAIDRINPTSMIAVPLIAEDLILGAMTLSRHAPHPEPFEDLEFELVEDLAVNVALVIRNARHLVEAQSGRARAEKKAEDQLRMWEGVFQHAGWGVATASLDGRFELANPAFAHMHGYGEQDLVGRPVSTVYASQSASEFATNMQVVKKEGHHTFEAMHLRRDGSVFQVSKDVAVISTPDGRAVRMIVQVQDLTERKQLEATLRRAAELESETLQFQLANRLKSDFLANMSHELRTPLNSIIGFAELLHDGEVGAVAAQQKEFLGDILASGRHLLQLINDVLDLAKVEAGKIEFYPEAIDLVRVITEVIAVTRTMAASKAIGVEYSVSPEIGAVEVDLGRFKQVLYNYLSNALKFTPDRGKVNIRVIPLIHDMFRLEVEDTGIGIESQEIGRLFGEFVQIDSSASKRHEGTGLGLALTKRLVEAQGGSVGATSVLGQGSCFHAVFPCHPAGAHHAEGSTRPFALGPGVASVLVVEDDPRDQATIARVLAEAGYSAELVSTGAQAIARCAERVFDAITLDLLLPDMNGLDVLKRIRSDPRYQSVPIVIITVVTERSTAGFSVHDVLTKPIDRDALLRSLERAGVLSRASGSVLVVDDDLSSLKLMATLLGQLGYKSLCHSDGEVALASVQRERPVAIVLDLLMPGIDGFEFLIRLRSTPENAQIPVLVWTMKDVCAEEVERLRGSAATVIRKGAGASELTATLRASLSQKILGGRNVG